MPSSRRTSNPRRKMFLNLSGQIEGQLREAYDRKYKDGLATQSSMAAKLGVNRSAIHHRLMGHTNMTIETIADMVWALDHAIKIDIFDPQSVHGVNHFIPINQPIQPAPLLGRSNTTTSVPSAGTPFAEFLREQTRSQTKSPIPVAS